MIRLRPFLNTDPPAIAEVWRSQPPMRGMMQPMSLELLDRLVLSKTYFDRQGLIVAEDGDQVVGFAHAGPVSDCDCRNTDFSCGVTCMVLTTPQCDEAVRASLLQACEEYLTARGATLLKGGPAFPADPFYLGLYGGANLCGILKSDAAATALFESAGYKPARTWSVMQRDLSGFRPVIDRKQMQIRRKFTIGANLDPCAAHWWDACTWGLMQQTEFTLAPRSGGEPAGVAMLWDMEPLASSWGVHAMGVSSIEVAANLRRQGAATFLLGEVLRQMQSHGVTLVETHVDVTNQPALGLFTKLGFAEVDQGVQYQKPAAT